MCEFQVYHAEARASWGPDGISGGRSVSSRAGVGTRLPEHLICVLDFHAGNAAQEALQETRQNMPMLHARQCSEEPARKRGCQESALLFSQDQQA